MVVTRKAKLWAVPTNRPSVVFYNNQQAHGAI
jgi:hypothetical protein